MSFYCCCFLFSLFLFLLLLLLLCCYLCFSIVSCSSNTPWGYRCCFCCCQVILLLNPTTVEDGVEDVFLLSWSCCIHIVSSETNPCISFRIQKLTLWISFRVQKLINWARECESCTIFSHSWMILSVFFPVCAPYPSYCLKILWYSKIKFVMRKWRYLGLGAQNFNICKCRVPSNCFIFCPKVEIWKLFGS